ncbi:hypothetical protein C8Q80DRAFT_468654 [Daedaleopsis nitida]|nr:hypothetical protein C8Q80DRAFT_468654 [Daedaleopsis nitida]
MPTLLQQFNSVTRKFRLYFRRPSSHDALALLVVALKIVKTTSDAISTVPLLGVIAGAVLDLTETLEKMHGNKEKCLQLAKRAADLLEHIKGHIESSPGQAASAALNDSLRRLVETLTSIRIKVEKELQRSWFYRFGHQSSVASTLDDCIQELEDAWHTFDTACLVLLHKEVEVLKDKMDSQAKYDDSSQVRIIRMCDVTVIEKNGTCRVLEKYEADEYRAEFKGRRVVLRQLRQSVKKGEVDFRSVMVYNPNLHGVHLNLLQVLGRSHPSVERPFYVMECGNVPLMHDYYLGAHGVPLVRSWLANYYVPHRSWTIGALTALPEK